MSALEELGRAYGGSRWGWCWFNSFTHTNAGRLTSCITTHRCTHTWEQARERGCFLVSQCAALFSDVWWSSLPLVVQSSKPQQETTATGEVKAMLHFTCLSETSAFELAVQNGSKLKQFKLSSVQILTVMHLFWVYSQAPNHWISSFRYYKNSNACNFPLYIFILGCCMLYVALH